MSSPAPAGSGAPARPGPVLVLASSSPRRRQLLAAHGYTGVEVCAVPVVEASSRQLTGCELVALNAGRKAGAARRRLRGDPRAPAAAVIVAADTLVWADDAAFGKPPDLAAAYETLSRLNGREHEVVTGVCVVTLRGHRHAAYVERTRVRFRRLDERALRAYLADINPLDKAGAYAAQDDRGRLIAETVGSRSNVVGLPVESLEPVLAVFGVRPGPARP